MHFISERSPTLASLVHRRRVEDRRGAVEYRAVVGEHDRYDGPVVVFDHAPRGAVRLREEGGDLLVRRGARAPEVHLRLVRDGDALDHLALVRLLEIGLGFVRELGEGLAVGRRRGERAQAERIPVPVVPVALERDRCEVRGGFRSELGLPVVPVAVGVDAEVDVQEPDDPLEGHGPVGLDFEGAGVHSTRHAEVVGVDRIVGEVDEGDRIAEVGFPVLDDVAVEEVDRALERLVARGAGAQETDGKKRDVTHGISKTR